MNETSNESNKEITIIIVTWNSKQFLPELFRSLENQSFKNFDIIIVDNSSLDGTSEFVAKNYPSVQLVKNKENLGFAKANNQAIKLAQTPFVLLCNPDIILDSEFLRQVLKIIKADEKIASVGGKLLKSNSGLNRQFDSATIDSTGIVIFKSRRAIDRGESEKDVGQFNKQEEVFGISGALVLYRKSALQKIAIDGEYFDEDFFAYKEDVDLAWRLRLAGFKSYYNPAAKAFHRRAAARKTDLSDKGTLVNRQKKSDLANYLSYRNHIFLLIKNETGKNLLNPYLLWYELKKLIYILSKEPASLKSIPKLFKKLPEILKKRKRIKKIKSTSNKELSKWFL